MLFRETEPIFNPSESKKWAALETPADKAAFFHIFWKRRDPDPISDHNERLLNHYERLHEAKKMYFQLNPHSLLDTSYTYYRLRASRPVYHYDNFYYDSDYDPDIWWDRCRQLALQQRGLFFIRHGQPDFLYRFGLPWDIDSKPYEAWRYGQNFFLFGEVGGGYWAYKSFQEAGNITKAMETESFRDPLPVCPQDFFAADFMSPGGGNELEFYHSVPAAVVPMEEAPDTKLHS